MSIIRKEGKPLVFKGESYPTATGVIDQVNCNKKRQECVFFIEYYLTNEDAVNRNDYRYQPEDLLQEKYTITGQEFLNHFGPQAYIQEADNGFLREMQAYNYIMTLDISAEGEEQNLAYKDWKSDES